MIQALISRCTCKKLKSKILAHSNFALVSCAQFCVLQLLIDFFMLKILLDSIGISMYPCHIGNSAKINKSLQF